jgi:hypothetical protein
LFEWSSERRLSAWLAAAPKGTDPWTHLVALLNASLPEPLVWRSRVWIEFCAMARVDQLRRKLGRFYDAWRPPFRQAIEDGIATGPSTRPRPSTTSSTRSSSSATARRSRSRWERRGSGRAPPAVFLERRGAVLGLDPP